MPSKGTTYAPVGHCIYCFDGVPPFTREHIVPKGLGGNLVLPASSCERCRLKILEVETFVQRDMMGSFRMHVGLSRSTHPEYIPLDVLEPSGKLTEIRVAPSDYPNTLTLIGLPMPGRLIGRARDADVAGDIWHLYKEDDVQKQRQMWPAPDRDTRN